MLKKIWKLISETFRIWSDARSAQMSAAFAYYSMLSMTPTLVIAIAIAGYVFDDQLVEQEIVSTVSQVTTPGIAKTIAELIGRAKTPESGVLAGAISLTVLFLGASGVFTQLYDTFNHIWHAENRRNVWWFTIQKRLVGMLMVIVIGLLLIAVLVLQSAVGYLNGFIDQYPVLVAWLNATDRSLTFLLMPIVFSMLFWFFPSTKIQLFDVVPAGVLTACLVAGSRYFIQIYLGLSSTGEVYGAMGSLVVMLIWIYMLAMIIFFGASFSCAWAHTFGSRRPELLSKQAREELERVGDEESPIVPSRRDAAQPSALLAIGDSEETTVDHGRSDRDGSGQHDGEDAVEMGDRVTQRNDRVTQRSGQDEPEDSLRQVNDVDVADDSGA